MTRRLVLCLSLLVLAVPVPAVAGNVSPKLCLEVYRFETQPDPVPEYVCRHAVVGTPQELSCYAPSVAYNTYVITLHVGALDTPICPSPGPGCTGYGGYLGVGFGVLQTGTTPHLTFVSWNACPGFLKGSSASGEPAACLASSTELCHGDLDHEGYLVYLNASAATPIAYFNVVNSADLGHFKVLNCGGTYDEGTAVYGAVQVGGAQTVICPTVPVEELTWGKMKSLYW